MNSISLKGRLYGSWYLDQLQVCIWFYIGIQKLLDDDGFVARNKASVVATGYYQGEGIEDDEIESSG